MNEKCNCNKCKSDYNNVESFPDFLSSLTGKFKNTKDNVLDVIYKTRDKRFIPQADYKLEIEDGVIQLEMIVAGHETNDIRVEYNNRTHELRIKDVAVDDLVKPWYYKNIDMTFELPETTDKSSFLKDIRNGVLTVSAAYKEVGETEDEFSEI